MQVTVLYSPAPREVLERVVMLEHGATVRDAVQASGLVSILPADWPAAGVGIWGRKAGIHDAVRDGDRVEIYRPLLVDPKLARRERFKGQGGRTGGLFAGGQNRRGR
jgi:uncharacterized protein